MYEYIYVYVEEDIKYLESKLLKHIISNDFLFKQYVDQIKSNYIGESIILSLLKIIFIIKNKIINKILIIQSYLNHFFYKTYF